MICKFCGNTIEDKSDFCFICGQKVVPEVAPVVAEAAAPAPAEPVAPTAPAEPVAPVAEAAAPVAPVYAQQTVYVEVPVEKKKKKKDKSVASRGCRFFAVVFAMTFFLQFIPWIWYFRAKKRGYEEKATAILNSTMRGLCLFMAIICFVMIKKYML